MAYGSNLIQLQALQLIWSLPRLKRLTVVCTIVQRFLTMQQTALE